MKLTWWNKCLMAGLVACALVGAAHAQAPGGQGGRGRGGAGGGFGGFGGRGGSTNLISLAGNEAVQKELALGDVIKDAIKEINDSYREAVQKAMGDGGGFAALRDMSEEERTKAMEKMNEQRTAVLAKFTPELKDALSPEQFKRLKEIHVQALRDQAYTDADVVKALALKKEQTDQIVEINKDYSAKMREAFQPGGGGGGDMRAKFEEMGKARDGKLSDVLTKDQQAKLKDLKGKEFDIAQLQQRGPGGGGPGGGGRPGTGGRPGGGRPAGDAPKADAPKSDAPKAN